MAAHSIKKHGFNRRQAHNSMPFSPALLAWLSECHEDKFHFNVNGKHVLHEMLEQLRKRESTFGEALFHEVVNKTMTLLNFKFDIAPYRDKHILCTSIFI